MEASSSDRGFFQQQPVLKNQLHDDPSLQRVLQLLLPSSLQAKLESELLDLGDKALSSSVFDAITDSEKNLPYLRGGGRDAFGSPRSDSLVVTQGWTYLQDLGIKHGVAAYNYDQDLGPFTRVAQLLRKHVWEASSSNTTCPVAMTDGAARLLQLHLAKPSLDKTKRAVFQNAYDHLISRDPQYAWTSGQWMTERPGGSDVSRTETIATYAPYEDGKAPLANIKEGIPLGPWSISGFKWFSSATDSSMSILLARTTPDKGVSAFFAPMRRYNPSLQSHTGEKGGTELNGVKISRLKDKMGTKSLPTAELELNNMRGWLIGEEGKGIHEIATILNITRVHSSVGALGYLGRGLVVAKAFALAREIGATKGRRVPLYRSPLHVRTLANMNTDYHAMMLLTYYSVFLVGLDEHPEASKTDSSTIPLGAFTPPPQHVQPLLRILTSVGKSYCCQKVIPLMYGCMEALGGQGYLNNSESEAFNLSRIFRDLCVLATWEGTTNVLASDTMRALKHPRSGAACINALNWFFTTASAESVSRSEWSQLKTRLEKTDEAALLADARDIVFRLADILMASLLAADANTDGHPWAKAVRTRFLQRAGLVDLKAPAEDEAEAGKEGNTLALDTMIAFGGENLDARSKASSKL